MLIKGNISSFQSFKYGKEYKGTRMNTLYERRNINVYSIQEYEYNVFNEKLLGINIEGQFIEFYFSIKDCDNPFMF
jgi:hypothetical protein